MQNRTRNAIKWSYEAQGLSGRNDRRQAIAWLRVQASG